MTVTFQQLFLIVELLVELLAITIFAPRLGRQIYKYMYYIYCTI